MSDRITNFLKEFAEKPCVHCMHFPYCLTADESYPEYHICEKFEFECVLNCENCIFDCKIMLTVHKNGGEVVKDG